MTVKPLDDRVLVEVAEENEKTASFTGRHGGRADAHGHPGHKRRRYAGRRRLRGTECR